MTSPASPAWARETDAAAQAALAAGRAIAQFYDRASAETYTKGDGSPVTDADLAADRIIRDILSERFPTDAILTEEGADDATRLAADRCWIVDPLDGTAQFVARTGHFDVRLALVNAGQPVVAVIYRPIDRLLYGAALERGAWCVQDGTPRELRFIPVAADRPPRLSTSVWLGASASLAALDRVADRLGAETPQVTTTGFGPHEFASPGRAVDAILGFGRDPDGIVAWEWDFAAADLIIHEAGGRFTNIHGAVHHYNKPLTRNVGGLLAAADPATHDRLLVALQPELP
jgi:3'-phosphoadenosine 5'-phosphosulfate (PAPS) 3'-phosphatase